MKKIISVIISLFLIVTSTQFVFASSTLTLEEMQNGICNTVVKTKATKSKGCVTLSWTKGKGAYKTETISIAKYNKLSKSQKKKYTVVKDRKININGKLTNYAYRQYKKSFKVDYYIVYRDGVAIAKTTETSFKDYGAEKNKKHKYKVVGYRKLETEDGGYGLVGTSCNTIKVEGNSYYTRSETDEIGSFYFVEENSYLYSKLQENGFEYKINESNMEWEKAKKNKAWEYKTIIRVPLSIGKENKDVLIALPSSATDISIENGVLSFYINSPAFSFKYEFEAIDEITDPGQCELKVDSITSALPSYFQPGIDEFDGNYGYHIADMTLLTYERSLIRGGTDNSIIGKQYTYLDGTPRYNSKSEDDRIKIEPYDCYYYEGYIMNQGVCFRSKCECLYYDEAGYLDSFTTEYEREKANKELSEGDYEILCKVIDYKTGKFTNSHSGPVCYNVLKSLYHYSFNYSNYEFPIKSGFKSRNYVNK